MSPEPRRPTGPTRREIVQGVKRELELAGLESPEAEAERLVAAGLDVSRAELTTEASVRVEPSAAARVARLVSRRLEGQPLQHIEGTVDFRRVRLVSDGRALIPRPETEQLVDHIAESIGSAPLGRALDIGTGSGAIGLALLDERLVERVVALDVSDAALDQAGENARSVGAGDIEFRRCGPDIWSALEPGERFDIVVSNPPYVATAEWEDLDSVVKDHEPHRALEGGRDGLEVIRRIVAGAPAALRDDGILCLEIGATQGDEVLELLRAQGGLEMGRIEPDLAGNTRFAFASRAPRT